MKGILLGHGLLSTETPIPYCLRDAFQAGFIRPLETLPFGQSPFSSSPDATSSSRYSHVEYTKHPDMTLNRLEG
jgi:hypothetical protein